jgi:hypothetical protein
MRRPKPLSYLRHQCFSKVSIEFTIFGMSTRQHSVFALLERYRSGDATIRRVDDQSEAATRNGLRRRPTVNHEVIVCSMMEPKTSVYWIKESIPSEIVILGDVVIFGWWSYDGPGELPPFFACHAPVVAANLRARTDHVVAR